MTAAGPASAEGRRGTPLSERLPRSIHVVRLGRMAYDDALEAQARQVEARRGGEAGDTLLLVEHPPVITLGARNRNLQWVDGRRDAREDECVGNQTSRTVLKARSRLAKAGIALPSAYVSKCGYVP